MNELARVLLCNGRGTDEEVGTPYSVHLIQVHTYAAFLRILLLLYKRIFHLYFKFLLLMEQGEHDRTWGATGARGLDGGLAVGRSRELPGVPYCRPM